MRCAPLMRVIEMLLNFRIRMMSAKEHGRSRVMSAWKRSLGEPRSN
jgi:hypothetical protein